MIQEPQLLVTKEIKCALSTVEWSVSSFGMIAGHLYMTSSVSHEHIAKTTFQEVK